MKTAQLQVADWHSRDSTRLGVSLLPATNPLDIAKGVALLPTPVEVPIPISSFVARALLWPLSIGLVNPLPARRDLMRRGVFMSCDKIRVVMRVGVRVKGAVVTIAKGPGADTAGMGT